LPAGGATAHHGRSLHFAGPNRSSAPRYAFIMAFEIPPVPLQQRRGFYWNRDKRAANMTRRRLWRLRGGLLIEALRKLRCGMWRQPARLKFEMRRAWRVSCTFAGGK
jgi:hypothetical protein